MLHTMRNICALISVLAIVAVGPDAHAQDSEPPAMGRFIRQIEGVWPAAVAVDGEGRILILDAEQRCVRMFTQDGKELESWGKEAHFIDPVALAPNAHGGYIVLDRVQALAARARGEKPTSSFVVDPVALARTPDKLFIADFAARRIDVASLGGTGNTTIELSLPEGVPNALPPQPVALTTDPDGRLYVVDGANHRVMCLDQEGKTVWNIGGLGTFPGQFVEPTDVAYLPNSLDPANAAAGQILVTDAQNHRVQAFNMNGEFLYQWGKHALVPRQGQGKIHYPNAVAASADGQFVVVAEMFERRVQLFGLQASGATAVTSESLPVPKIQSHFGQLMGVDGRLAAVWEPEMRRVLVFDLSHAVPINITQFGEYGTKFGEFTNIIGMAIRAVDQDVYVLDEGTGRIDVVHLDFDPKAPVKFDALMPKFVRSIPVRAVLKQAGVEYAELGGITLADDGTVFVANSLTGQVHRFTQAGEFKDSWGTQGLGEGELCRPTALGYDAAHHRLLVLDSALRRVLAFDSDGQVVATFDHAGPGDAFIEPTGVCADPDGNVYIIDGGRDEAFKLSPTGELIKKWGGTGILEAKFWMPSAIGFDAQHRVIVLDFGNHRGQLFKADGDWLATFSAGRVQTRPTRKVETSEPQQQ